METDKSVLNTGKEHFSTVDFVALFIISHTLAMVSYNDVEIGWHKKTDNNLFWQLGDSERVL